MSILKMRLIVLIDRYKQVTAVANALNMKQPTISFHMKNMEAEWGVKLFQTRTGRVMLTEAGKTLLQYAAQIDALYTEANSRMADMQGNEKSRFVIGCTEASAAALAQSGWAASVCVLEDIRITTITGEEEDLFDKLKKGLIDLVVCGKEPLKDSGRLVSLKIGASSLRLVLAPAHPLLAEGETDNAALAAYPFIFHTEGSITDCVSLMVKRERLKLKTRACFNSTALVISAVHAGLGLSLLPDCLLPDDAGGLAVMDIPGETLQWSLQATWVGDYWNLPAIQRVLETIRL